MVWVGQAGGSVRAREATPAKPCRRPPLPLGRPGRARQRGEDVVRNVRVHCCSRGQEQRDEQQHWVVPVESVFSFS